MRVMSQLPQAIYRMRQTQSPLAEFALLAAMHELCIKNPGDLFPPLASSSATQTHPIRTTVRKDTSAHIQLFTPSQTQLFAGAWMSLLG